MPLLLRLKLIFLALLLGDFGVFMVRLRVTFQNVPIALNFIVAGCIRFVDTLFLALGDCLPLCLQLCKPRIGFSCGGARGSASSQHDDRD